MLAVLGGYGLRRRRDGGGPRRRARVACGLAFSAERRVLPFIVNGMGRCAITRPGSRASTAGARAGGLPGDLARQSGVVLAELPLGQPDFDLRAMFYSTVHQRALLNGYSGFFPPHYGRAGTGAVRRAAAHATIAWAALRSARRHARDRPRGRLPRRPGAAVDDCAALTQARRHVEVFRATCS